MFYFSFICINVSSKYLVYAWFYCKTVEFERIRTIFFKKKSHKIFSISRQQGIIISRCHMFSVPKKPFLIPLYRKSTNLVNKFMHTARWYLYSHHKRTKSKDVHLHFLCSIIKNHLMLSKENSCIFEVLICLVRVKL